jgi:hypothetical protein
MVHLCCVYLSLILFAAKRQVRNRNQQAHVQRLEYVDHIIKSTIQGVSDVSITAQHIEYEPLATDFSFRLLRLNNCPPGSNPQDLPCTIANYNLEEAPQVLPFRALSYTWGPPFSEIREESPYNLLARIECNGRPISITRNLYDALRAFRDSGMEDCIWVDAICINQQDPEERAQQVCNMNHIYERAAEVIVWLGTPRPGLEDLHWATTDFLRALKSAQPHNGVSVFDSDLRDPSIQSRFGIPDAFQRLCRAAIFCTNTQWFERVWVFQEVVLSSHTRVFCGRMELSWNGILELAQILHMSSWYEEITQPLVALSPPGYQFMWLTRVVHLHRLVIMKDAIRQAKPPQWNRHDPFSWFNEVLQATRGAKCRDKVDCVYSILGVVNLGFVKAERSV